MCVVKGFGLLVRMVVGKRPVLDPSELRFVDDAERGWMAIRDEALSVIGRSLDQEVGRVFQEQRSMLEGAPWKMYSFLAYGVEFKEHMDQCPVTANLVRSYPEISTAFFSILPAGARLKPHFGPFNGVLRYHLGLIVPKDPERCRLVVDGQPLSWKEGGSLLFDDTYLHEAYNLTDELRVVLFIDVVRKLPFPLNRLNALLFNAISNSPYIQNALRESEQLEELNYERRKVRFS